MTDKQIKVLDLGLPDNSGLETFLRAHAQSPQIPLIALSGLDDEVLAVDAVRKGAQDYNVGTISSLVSFLKSVIW